MYNRSTKAKTMTKEKRKQYADQYIDRIQRRNTTASVISALLWLCGVFAFGASFYLNYFPLFIESLAFMAGAWLVGLTIKR